MNALAAPSLRNLPYFGPMLTASVLFFLAPLVVLAVYSFSSPEGASLANYARFANDEFSVSVLIDTIRLGASVVLGTTLLGLPIALLYWHAGPRIRQWLIFLILLPMLVSNVVRTFAWIVILGRQGLISSTLLYTGLSSTPTNLMYTEFGLILALCQIELPLLLLPIIAVLSRANRSLVDAARMLGAGSWRVLLTVLVPVMLPGLLAGWILVFASACTSYVTQAVIGGARLIYLPQFIYREVGVLFSWPYAAAVAFVLLVSTGVVMLSISALSRHRRLVGHA